MADSDLPDGLQALAPCQNGSRIVSAVRRTHSIRDIRDALAVLAQHVHRNTDAAAGVCVVVESRITRARLEDELERFHEVLQPRIQQALFIGTVDAGGQVAGRLPDWAPDLPELIRKAVQTDATPAGAKVSRQYVKVRLAERWCAGLPRENIAEMRRQSGASYQTVAAALTELASLGAVYDGADGLPALHGFTAAMLIKLAEEHLRARKTVAYVDPTGLSRSPLAMAKRLLDRLGLSSDPSIKGAAMIGGVIGATHYYPELDISAAPRLDICMEHASPEVVSIIDAGLVDQKRSTVKREPVLVIHMQKNLRQVATEGDDRIASRLDCIADLLEMGFQREAAEFAHHLVVRRPSKPVETA